MIPITAALSIPEGELAYRASRSGGPGGQHVNTSSTRIELVWNAAESPSLTDEQRARILEKLSNRISGEGVLTLASSATRSQQQNRAEVTVRFAELLREALHVPRRRKKTRPPRAARERRLRAKRRRSDVKRLRRSIPDE
ncbi:MAG TPA: alternative ribosome rescue aminoacyl-tRNA hydrolase ArfB [Longimicrobiaceae bacterium]|nr:alternative ribosome rescue aminoacyl-tRNA hydrolase ArfB [Longimicrobiaceae bacterium]